MAVKRLELMVPAKLFELLDRAEQKTGIRKEDLIARALIKVIEEFGVKVG